MSPQWIDYCDSPEAPGANSLVPSVNVAVVNDAGEILLIRRADNGANPRSVRVESGRSGCGAVRREDGAGTCCGPGALRSCGSAMNRATFARCCGRFSLGAR
jgi:hypothetical protein